MSLTVKVDMKAFNKGFARLPKVMFEATKDGYERGLAGFRKEWVPTIKSRGIKKASRWLWKGFARGKNLATLEGRFFPKAYHQSFILLDEGGTVRPKKGQNIAIPLGSLRKGGKQAKALKGKATPEFWLRRNRGKKLFRIGNLLFESGLRGRGADRKATGVRKPLFKLAKSKKVKAVLSLKKAWKKGKPRFIERVNKNINKGLRKIYGSKAVK